MLINFKDEDFEKKIKSEEISICQFSASWCNPCKSLKPILDKLSDTYKDKTQSEILSNFLLDISLPLKKTEEKFTKFLNPKLSLRHSPNKTKNIQNLSKQNQEK